MNQRKLPGVALVPAVALWAATLTIHTLAAQTTTPDRSGVYSPYADNNGVQLPPGYTGPRYRLNHNYPTTLATLPPDPPWRKALGGRPIGKDNATTYVQALKDYIAKDVSVLVNDYTRWNPFAAGWYDQPWIGPKLAHWQGREAIQGTYPGPGFDRTIYPDLKVPFMQDYVAVYYNNIAGFTLHRIWQNPNPYAPNTGQAQFHEGAIIIKLALTNVSGKDWPPMEGSARSAVFVPPPTANEATGTGAAQILPVYAMQLDVIVKDSVTAPRTGWVFSTLVYDKRLKGTTWDRMVPLGAMWGNDPGVDDENLKETVINPAAPDYAKITLGWGLRLSGPNDGATRSLHPPVKPLRVSSCMSCHGTAEFPATAGLLPTDSTGKFFAPGSPDWDQWFQDRAGAVPQSGGQHVALDYDMVTRQALINWDAARESPAAVERAQWQLKMLRARGKRGAY